MILGHSKGQTPKQQVLLLVLVAMLVGLTLQNQNMIKVTRTLTLQIRVQREKLEDLKREVAIKQKQLDQMEKTKEERKLPEVYAVATFQATAYTLECGNGDGFTATGTIPQVGRTVAVDPRVIPYGTEVWINGQGPYVAEDTGGAIKGHRLDIYMGSGPDAYTAAIQWGRRGVEVTWKLPQTS